MPKVNFVCSWGRNGLKKTAQLRAASKTGRYQRLGAAVGGTVGMAAGADDGYKKHESEIAECLRNKGYVVTG